MRKNIIEFSNKDLYDYSCSEKIMYSANNLYKLELSQNEYKVIAPFSGGMFEKETCGIITAGLAVLGIMFTNNVAHTSPLLRDAVLEFKTIFNERLGSTVCGNLIVKYQDDITGCNDLVVVGGEILEGVIDKYVKLLK